MAITQTLCSSFKEQILLGEHNLESNTLKMALYTSLATLGASTTAYTTSDEVSASGTNYTTGGNVLSNVAVSLDGTTAVVTFSNVSWPASTITARGALIYNSSQADKAIAVLDFGADKSSNNTSFTVEVPGATATTAIIRIA